VSLLLGELRINEKSIRAGSFGSYLRRLIETPRITHQTERNLEENSIRMANNRFSIKLSEISMIQLKFQANN
jgi:hypothetical protein